MPRNQSERIPDYLIEAEEAAREILAAVEACPVCSNTGVKMSCYNHRRSYTRWVHAIYDARVKTSGECPRWEGSFSETLAALQGYIKTYRAPKQK